VGFEGIMEEEVVLVGRRMNSIPYEIGPAKEAREW
jgi:hypothetical protein